MVAGCDGIVHLGGQSVEADWDTVRDSNIEGLYHLYEAARKHKVGRIFFASSNHVIGYYPQSQLLDAQTPPRPDGLYGVSKAFGEALASLYHDKFGIETAIVRIDSRVISVTNNVSTDDEIKRIEKENIITNLIQHLTFAIRAQIISSQQ